MAVVILLALACVAGGLIPVITFLVKKRLVTLLLFGAIFWGWAVWLVRWVIVANRRHRLARAAALRSLPPGPPHPLAERLSAAWWYPVFLPSRDDLVKMIREHGLDADRAVIVALGVAAPPPVGDLRFEPEIVPTTRYLKRRLKTALPVWIMVMLFWLMDSTSPSRSGLPVWLFLVPMLLSLGILWTWKGIVRPTYIRTAPGVIQILQYSMRGSAPNIRSYPMIAGTLVIVAEASGKPQLHLARSEMLDTIPLFELPDPAAALERIWPALLSTAPTPPLSDVELVG